jgi:serine/threonine protein kinase
MRAMSEVAPGRVGDYCVTRSLPPVAPGVLELAATHVLLPRLARIRVLTHDAPDMIAKRLTREACILEAMRHPSVPRIYECGHLPDRRFWVAVEMLDGPTLADAIADRPLSPAETLALVRDAAELLHHTHVRGVVHCRLRPELLVRHETGLCIVDWSGAATVESDPQLEPADYQMYLAPELAAAASFDARADIFSLGVIAYEALTLAAPTLPLAKRSPALQTGIVELVERMTSPAAFARPTAAEVRAEAMRLLGLLVVPEPVEPIDGLVVEEIEIELSHDLSRDPPSRYSQQFDTP